MIKKENQKQNQTDSTEHIHKNQKWIKKALCQTHRLQ